MSNPILLPVKGLLAWLLIITSLGTKAQCLTSSYRNGSTFTTENPGGFFNFNFSNTSNVATANNSYSSASSILALLVGNTYYLKATGFGFTMASYSSICGITVQIEKKANGLGLWSTITDNQVRIIKGGAIVGNNKASATEWTDSEVTATYGGGTDLWGTTFTPNEVNDPNFGVAISVHITGIVVAPAAEIDNIRIMLDYNPVLPIKLAYFNSNKKGNLVQLEWKTTEEEDNAYISLQRSFNNDNNWQELKQYQLGFHNHDKLYKYEEQITKPGKYAYRLKMVNAEGAITYSAIRNITVADEKTIAVYPNPASDFIMLDATGTEKEVIISDAFARKWILPVNKINATTAQINIRSLPKGIYFINNGFQRGKFLKE